MHKLTKRVKRNVKYHALNSLYIMNSSGADCYAFNIIKTEKKPLDFEGGWDWLNRLVDKEAEWLYLMKEDKFIKVKDALKLGIVRCSLM